MPGKDTVSMPALPDGFWDGLKVAIVSSSEQYPLLTFASLLVFGLLLCLGLAGIYGFVTVKKDKIKYDYEGKKLKSEMAIERFRQKQREAKAAIGNKRSDGSRSGKKP